MAERPIRCRDIGTGHQFQCRRCAACEIERLSPRPAPEAIGAYYPTGYSPYRVRQETLGARVKRLAHDAWWASDNRFGALRPLLRALTYPVRGRPVLSFPAPRLRRVFEIGAASGNDLADFREAGWEVSGCEPSAHACALAAERGIVLQNCTAEHAVIEPGSVSCIVMTNVFEHLHDPVGVLRICREALQPDGLLVLSVPNHDCWAARAFGSAWTSAPLHPSWRSMGLAWTASTIAPRRAGPGCPASTGATRPSRRPAGGHAGRSRYPMR
jgi:SAM-dependent methyltransferase